MNFRNNVDDIADALLEQEEGFDDNIFDDPANNQFNQQQQPAPQQYQQPAPQNQRPVPALPGVGNMSRDDFASALNNFWDDPQNRQPNNQQQQPAGSGLGAAADQFFSQLAAQSAPGNEQTNAQDAAWDAFLNQREFAPPVDDMQKLFDEAGSDPKKTVEAMRSVMQSSNRAVYRQLATDMQETMHRMIAQLAPQIFEQKFGAIRQEEQFSTTLRTFVTANPAYGAPALQPVVSQVLQRAMAHANGDAQAAFALAKQFLLKNVGVARHNNPNNPGQRGTTDWSQHARR